jgi:hypothetical protein
MLSVTNRKRNAKAGSARVKSPSPVPFPDAPAREDHNYDPVPMAKVGTPEVEFVRGGALEMVPFDVEEE